MRRPATIRRRTHQRDDLEEILGSARSWKRVVRFFERLLIHVKGPAAGKPFILAPWQVRDIVKPLYGTMEPDGLRRYRAGFLSVARKNGKTALAAGLSLYHLFGGDREFGGEVYTAASSRDQASLIYDVAAAMTEASPILKARAHIQRSRKMIRDRRTNSVLKALSADVPTAHGLNSSAIFIDEIAQQPDRRLYDVLATSMGARAPAIDVEALKGQTCYPGLDLSSTTDITCLAPVFPLADGTFAVLLFAWLPKAGLAERCRRDRVPYDLWAQQGYIELTEGNAVDYSVIEDRLRQLSQTYDVREIAFDPWNGAQLAQRMMQEGATMVEFRQTMANFASPTKSFEGLVLDHKIRHGANPLLRWCVDCTTVRTDSNGNMRPVKPDRLKDRRRIDAVPAAVDAVHRDRRRRHTFNRIRAVQPCETGAGRRSR